MFRNKTFKKKNSIQYESICVFIFLVDSHENWCASYVYHVTGNEELKKKKPTCQKLKGDKWRKLRQRYIIMETVPYSITII